MLVNIPPADDLLIYVEQMINLEASDFFLVPGEPPTFRVGNDILRQEVEPLLATETDRLTGLAFGEEMAMRLGSELGVLRGVLAVESTASGQVGSPLRVLIAAARAQGGLTLSGRIAAYQIPSPQEIDLPEAVLEAAEASHGLLIFTGPTGSGKSTAAACVVEHLNATRKGHICLLGDPMEFHLEPKQCLLQHKDLGVDMPDFAAGMTAALAQDIDVLYLSEIRSAEDLRMCLTVAQTGHLVVTVLHAKTPEEAIERVRRAFPAEVRESSMGDFAEVLRCVAALKLLPKATGKGRVAAYSILVPDGEMRDAIAKGGNILDRETQLPDGCQEFAASITSLLEDKVITEDVAAAARAET